MFVVVAANGSGTIVYVQVYSTLALAQTAQTAAIAAAPPGWSVQLFSTPATDAAWGDTGGEM